MHLQFDFECCWGEMRRYGEWEGSSEGRNFRAKLHLVLTQLIPLGCQLALREGRLIQSGKWFPLKCVQAYLVLGETLYWETSASLSGDLPCIASLHTDGSSVPVTLMGRATPASISWSPLRGAQEKGQKQIWMRSRYAAGARVASEGGSTSGPRLSGNCEGMQAGSLLKQSLVWNSWLLEDTSGSGDKLLSVFSGWQTSFLAGFCNQGTAMTL